MPFKSERQRRFLFMHNPELARRWADEQKRKKKGHRTEAMRRMLNGN